MKSTWLWLAAALIVGVVVHIASVIAVPYLASRDAWARLAELAPTNRMHVLPEAGTAARPLPLMAADVRYAFCRYDLRAGPIKVRTRLPHRHWSVSLYDRYGDNFYTVSAGEIGRKEIEFLVVVAKQETAETGVDAPEGSDDVLVVNAPAPLGIVMIRAPLMGRNYAEITGFNLKRAFCGRR